MRRILLVLTLLATIVPAGAQADTPCDWTMYQHDSGRSGASDCSDISLVNVASARVKWVYPTPSPVTAQPAVVDDVLYVGSGDGTFYAMPTDPIGPALPIWTFEVDDLNLNSYGKIVSSALVETIGDTKVVLFAGGSTLYMLDAETGTELDSVCVDPRQIANPCGGSDDIIEIESSPVIAHMPNGDLLVLTGMDFNEAPSSGRAGLIAMKLDPETLTLTPVWKLDPETELSYNADPDAVGPGVVYAADPLTAGGNGNGCGNVWSSASIDVDNNLAFFAVANCGRTLRAGEVGGEGHFGANLTTGKMEWSFRPRPNDTAHDPDFDFGATPLLLPNDKVGAAGKDGDFYIYNRVASGTNTPVSRKHHVTGSDIGGFIGSSALGKVNGTDAVFSANAIQFSTRDPDESFEENLTDPSHMTTLHALDAATGELLWNAPNVLPSYAPVTYANGLVYLADTFGFQVQIYDANTGVPVWAHPLNGAPSSGPVPVGDSFYMGTGTAADPVAFIGGAAGIWAFQAVTLP